MQHTVINSLLGAMNFCKMSSRHGELSSIPIPRKSLHEELRRRQTHNLPLRSMASVVRLEGLNARRIEAMPPVKIRSLVNFQQLRKAFYCSQLEAKLDPKTSPGLGLLVAQDLQRERTAHTDVLNCASNLCIKSMQSIDQVDVNIDGQPGEGQTREQNSACGSARRCHHCSDEGFMVRPSLATKQTSFFAGNKPQMFFK